MKLSNLMGATALASAAFLFPQIAFAQGSQPVEAAPCNEDPNGGPDCVKDATGAEDNSGTVTITGSRIRRPNLESTVPITSLSGEQFFAQGDSNVGETLNELPQLRSTFSQQNPGLGIGIAGLNLLDLRGLGTSRTLVLVNGRRHVAADILNNAVSPDINSIPNDLIERVDVVTGGNSAIYGSDAIAGVVNFVLRRDYDGLQIRGQTGISPDGFGANQYISAMGGKNFADGRGNVTLHAEYSNQDRVFGSELPWLRQVNGTGVVDVDPSGLTGGSDGFPDSIFLRDVRSASINRFGLIPISQRATQAGCGIGAGASNGPPSSVGGTPYNCTYLFQPGGNLVAQTGTRYGAGIIGGILGGNGQTGREGKLLSIQPEVKRYNFNLLAHFAISDAFEPFIEAKYTRVDAVGNNASPTGIQGIFSQFDFRERTRLDNPFLTPAQRGQIAGLILASGCNTSLQVACSTAAGALAARSATAGQGTGGQLNAADIAAINAGTYRFVTARSLEDVGNRDEVFRRDTYRIVGGVRGTFNEDWGYEVSLNYGKFEQTVDTNGYVDRQRFMLALDAGRNPVTGAIQCRSQFDPAAAVAFDSGAFQTGSAGRTSPGQPGRLASDVAACVAYNPFGNANNQAAVNYFTRSIHTDASLEQFVASAFVSGDLSQLFELPGGPIGFALGAEYRREDGTYFDDPFVTEGDATAGTQSNTNTVVIGNFDPPAFTVKELFGELRVPLVKDVFLLHELSLSGAARVADYNNATGTVWTYNAGVDWAPVQDLRFRANYSRAVRSPNLSELYFPAIANFAPGFVDPCSPNQLANNPNRPANCLAQVGGNAAILAGIPNVTQSLAVISGSNPNLEEEKSSSWTFGGVFQPRFVPGLSLSVDYYNIKVENVIVSLTAQQIANNCVDQPTTENVFCGLFQRYLGPTPGPLAEVQGQIAGNTLIQAGVNFAARKRRGIDTNLAYRTNLGSNVTLSTNVIYTHNLQISNFENPALPDFENRVLSELGDPKDEFRWDTDIGIGAFTLGYRMRYIGPMYTSSYENFESLPSACSTPTTCPPNNVDVVDPRKYPSIFYHDLRFAYDVNKQFEFYVGADNILNTHPPLGLSGTGTGATTDRGTGNASIYDAFGRKVYAGFRARF
ncbi:TonB-dependent receptor domain-containing protein [Sphingomonas sp. S2-65]|uniref:TonB-dependent receptor domain-containing protein n=1 Tax=Sphingomonas sp. S2-65 TaxID=2903960 RepID=UPI001F169DF8|nr:TonB-dependent receptor [Sphingomonas sp. S2-65]UYY60167.1 TonB-dependent receptor [Sphingomonas sp. S2-65]